MRVRAFLLALIALCALPAAANAMRISPMVFDLEPTGPRAAATIQVENVNPTRLNFEVKVYKRSIGVNGEDTRTPAPDDFRVFPLQGSVEPGRSQAVRVQYVGRPDIRQSEQYVVMVEQLPVEALGSNSAGVRMVMSFGSSVSVIPRGARAALSARVSPADSPGHVVVDVQNGGNAVTRLGEWSWRFRAQDGATFDLVGDPLKAQVAQPLILPNTSRRFVIALPPEFHRKGVTSVEFRPPARG